MIIVMGEVLFDVFENDRRIGGAPFNFAFHLKQLGWPVRLLTRVGEDEYGKEILELLRKFGFSTDDVQIDPVHPTGTVQVQLDGNGVPQFDIRKDVAYDYIDPAASTPVDWAGVKMLYFGSLVQRTEDGFQRIQQWIRGRTGSSRLFCDINLRPPHVNTDALAASLKAADIIKLNDDELDRIIGTFGGQETDGSGVDWIFRAFSPELLILTLGEKGSALITPDHRVEVGRTDVDRVADTVGAGDAFAAVSAMGVMKHLPLATIGKTAASFAARICTLPGAVPDDPAVYDMLRPTMEG